MPNVYHGRNATLAHQFETQFRTPPGVPGTQLLKFSELTMGRVPELQEDPTINADALVEKRDEVDATAPISLKAILCLNDIGTYLKALLGAPVTTGAGPYNHVFTLGLGDRPSSLFELALSEPTPTTRYHRHLGAVLNTLEYDLIEADQSFSAEFLGAVEERPYPVAPFDATPTALRAKNRACKKQGKVWDGAASIGDIAKASIRFSNDMEGLSLADGQEGFGQVLLGQPSIGGSMDILFTPGTLVDAALARTSKHVVLVSKNTAGDASLTVDIPQVEFDVPRVQVATSKGIVVRGLAWQAHKGGAPVTVTLVNNVATY